MEHERQWATKNLSNLKNEWTNDVKVIGVKWGTIAVEISVDIEKVLEHIQSLQATKRGIFKAMAKIYDLLDWDRTLDFWMSFKLGKKS